MEIDPRCRTLVFNHITQLKPIKDLHKRKSVVNDFPDEKRRGELEHQEIKRMKKNSNYTVVTDYEFGKKKRRK